MKELVSELQGTSGKLHSLAQLSYRHELGFTKLTVGEVPDRRLKLRLHLWHREAMPNEANIHNHRFDGYSYVVDGVVQDTRWEVQPAPNGSHLHYRYTPRLDSSEYVLRYFGRAFLHRMQTIDVQEGEVYGFSATELHTTAVVSSSLLTLFLEDRSCLRAHADVFTRRYPANHHRIAAHPLSEGEYLHLLRAIAHYFKR